MIDLNQHDVFEYKCLCQGTTLKVCEGGFNTPDISVIEYINMLRKI